MDNGKARYKLQLNINSRLHNLDNRRSRCLSKLHVCTSRIFAVNENSTTYLAVYLCVGIDVSVIEDRYGYYIISPMLSRYVAA